MKKYLWKAVIGLFFVLAGIYYYFVVFTSESKNVEVLIEQQKEDIKELDPVLESVIIYICGAVKNPGVYQLIEGSRISDGIIAAGGLNEDAAPQVLNLAAKLVDEQKIYIPTQLEVEQETTLQKQLIGTETQKQDQSNKKIDLNLATAEELTMLPGIGKKRAEAIISYRESMGGFTSSEQLTEIEGIGEAMFEKIKEFITVGEK